MSIRKLCVGTTYIVAFGNAFRARPTSESGVGEPPNSKPSRGWPASELSIKSATIDGTLVNRDELLEKSKKKNHKTYPPATPTFSSRINLEESYEVVQWLRVALVPCSW